MRDCKQFAGKNLPVDSVHALSGHLPVYTTDVRRSVYTAATLTAISDDVRSTDFDSMQIGVKLLTRDPGLQIIARGFLEANMSEVLEMVDERAGRRFVGNFSSHAHFVQWAECSLVVAG